MATRPAKSIAAEAAFRAKLAALGAELLETEWLGSLKPHRIRCAAGHDCAPRPAGLQQGQGICRACAGLDSAHAEAAFKLRLAELGATLLEERWLGVSRPHKVRCSAGHDCAPRPLNVSQGNGICRACAGTDKAHAEAEFRTRLAAAGAVLLEPYVSNRHPHRVRCAAGHECFPRPNNIHKGQGFCRACAGQDPAMAAAAFLSRVEQQGGTVLGRYVNATTRVLVRCKNDHECRPTPNHVQQGGGICPACSGNSPEHAAARFRARLEELGATLLEPYVTTKTPVRVRCAAGHECWPAPSCVLAGQGVCAICAKRDPATAEAAFRARIAELGGIIVGVYVNNRTPVSVRCKAGHECRPLPSSVQRGQGICRICLGLDPAAAEAKFRARIAELGGTVMGPYVNADTPVLVHCAAGHRCLPRPGNTLTWGICKACVGLDPAVVKAAFQLRVKELGGQVVGRYINSKTPVLCRCKNGHDCRPTSGHVLAGHGICGRCAGKEWDMFYVVASGEAVKFGITSGDPRPRLRLHKAAGYRTVVRLLTVLPDDTALELENAVKATLRLARIKPIKGKEYFDIDALAVILDIVDNYPIPGRDLEASKEVA